LTIWDEGRRQWGEKVMRKKVTQQGKRGEGDEGRRQHKGKGVTFSVSYFSFLFPLPQFFYAAL